MNQIDEHVKFSVVIPLYNKEHYIKRTLKSVLKQTYPHFEVIVVDDGSSDQSLKVAKTVKDERIRLITQENAGVAVARNTGIYAATSDYVAFLDADDEWHENYLETIAELVKRFPESDMFVTAYEVNMGKGKRNYSRLLEPEYGCLNSYWATLGSGYDFVWTSATAVRRSALLAAGCFKPGEKTGQDLDMWARVARNNKKVAYAAKNCVSYNRMAEENARSRVKVGYAAAFIKDLMEELDNPAHSEEELRAISWKYELKMIVYIYTLIVNGEKKKARKVLSGLKTKAEGKKLVLRFCLLCASFLPTFINKKVYEFRLKVF